MAVVEVNERREGRRARATRDGRTYTRVFYVRVDSVEDGPYVARLADGVPRVGAVHHQDLTAFCESVEPQMISNDPLNYDVVCEYSSSTNGSVVTENPLEEPAQITWGFVRSTQVIEQDIEGNTILNSAGDVYDPPVEQDVSHLVLTVERNESSFDAAAAYDFIDSVNSDSVTLAGLSVGPRGARLLEYSGRSAFSNGVGYWQITYQIQFAETWTRQILDLGFNEIVEGEKRRIRITGSDGIPRDADVPQLLDGAGALLAAGANPVYRTFNTYKERPWGSLTIT